MRVCGCKRSYVYRFSLVYGDRRTIRHVINKTLSHEIQKSKVFSKLRVQKVPGTADSPQHSLPQVVPGASRGRIVAIIIFVIIGSMMMMVMLLVFFMGPRRTPRSFLLHFQIVAVHDDPRLLARICSDKIPIRIPEFFAGFAPTHTEKQKPSVSKKRE